MLSWHLNYQILIGPLPQGRVSRAAAEKITCPFSRVIGWLAFYFFIHSFLHLFRQQKFVKHLLCARHQADLGDTAVNRWTRPWLERVELDQEAGGERRARLAKIPLWFSFWEVREVNSPSADHSQGNLQSLLGRLQNRRITSLQEQWNKKEIKQTHRRKSRAFTRLLQESQGRSSRMDVSTSDSDLRRHSAREQAEPVSQPEPMAASSTVVSIWEAALQRPKAQDWPWANDLPPRSLSLLICEMRTILLALQGCHRSENPHLCVTNTSVLVTVSTRGNLGQKENMAFKYDFSWLLSFLALFNFFIIVKYI